MKRHFVLAGKPEDEGKLREISILPDIKGLTLLTFECFSAGHFSELRLS